MRIALTSLPFAFSIHDSWAGTLALLRHRSPVFSHVDPSGQTFIKLKTRYNPTRNCALSVFSAETADMFYLHSSQLVIYRLRKTRALASWEFGMPPNTVMLWSPCFFISKSKASSHR